MSAPGPPSATTGMLVNGSAAEGAVKLSSPSPSASRSDPAGALAGHEAIAGPASASSTQPTPVRSTSPGAVTSS